MIAGITSDQVLMNAQARLIALRKALEDCADLNSWLSGQSLTDLTGIGFSSADAQAVQSALADANALAEFYNTGLPPSTYPQPPSAYIYGSSQRAIVGPQ